MKLMKLLIRNKNLSNIGKSKKSAKSKKSNIVKSKRLNFIKANFSEEQMLWALLLMKLLAKYF